MERWAKSGQIHATMELGFELFREKREKGEEEEEERRHKTLVGLAGFTYADRAVGFDVADQAPRVTDGQSAGPA